ncbi:beta strand repeat-containing protein [Ilyonectria robusta]
MEVVDVEAAPLATDNDSMKPPVSTQPGVLDAGSVPLTTGKSNTIKHRVLTQLTNTEVLDPVPVPLATGNSDSLEPPASTQLTNMEVVDVETTPLATGSNDCMKPPPSTQLTNTEVLDSGSAPLTTGKSNTIKHQVLTQLTNTEVLDHAPVPLATGNSDSTKPPVSTQPISPDASEPKSAPPWMHMCTPEQSRFALNYDYRGIFSKTEFWEPSASLITKEERVRWKDEDIFGYAAIPERVIHDFSSTLDQAVGLFANACLPNTYQLRWESLDTEALNHIKAWAPKAELYLGHQYGGHGLLMSACVWRVLFDNLFSEDCHDKWAGQRWADYDKARRDFQGKAFPPQRITPPEALY